jgi:hypothetical protein
MDGVWVKATRASLKDGLVTYYNRKFNWTPTDVDEFGVDAIKLRLRKRIGPVFDIGFHLYVIDDNDEEVEVKGFSGLQDYFASGKEAEKLDLELHAEEAQERIVPNYSNISHNAQFYDSSNIALSNNTTFNVTNLDTKSSFEALRTDIYRMMQDRNDSKYEDITNVGQMFETEEQSKVKKKCIELTIQLFGWENYNNATVSTKKKLILSVKAAILRSITGDNILRMITGDNTKWSIRNTPDVYKQYFRDRDTTQGEQAGSDSSDSDSASQSDIHESNILMTQGEQAGSGSSDFDSAGQPQNQFDVCVSNILSTTRRR